MKLHISRTMAAALLFATLTATGVAQNPDPTPAPSQQAKPLTPLKVQVVIARYEGDKKVSSFPYMLAVTSNSPQAANLRMGSLVPVPTGQGGIDYKSIGTNIDCSATSMEDGRFQVQVRIEDASVMERRGGDAPTLRTFSSSNTVVLKDGQTAQFTAAADKVTGEVVKVDVTMNIEK